MKFTYQLTQEDGRVLATCVESDAMGEGANEAAAIASLKTSIHERMFRPDAIAPPSQTSEEPIELRPARDAKSTSKERDSLDLGGPGDAPVR